MPRITLAQIENEIRAERPDATRSEIKKAAKLRQRRPGHTPHEDALLRVKAITYTDETGDLATGIRSPR